MTPVRAGMLAFVASLALAAAPAHAQDAPADSAAGSEVAVGAEAASPVAPAPPAHRRDGLEALVPALAENAYTLESGPRPFLDRLAVTPAFGALGSNGCSRSGWPTTRIAGSATKPSSPTTPARRCTRSSTA